MGSRHRRFVVVALLIAVLGGPSGRGIRSPAQAAAAGKGSISDPSPVMLVQNVGQWDPAVRFRILGGRQALWLTDDALWVTVGPSARGQPGVDERSQRWSQAVQDSRSLTMANVKLGFVGADPSPRIRPFEPLDVRVSYLRGTDPKGWRRHVPVWGGVRYVDLYPGVDLELTTDGQGPVQRLVAQDKAALEAVRLRVEGADRVVVAGSELRLSTAAGGASIPLFQAVSPAGRPLVPTTAPRAEGNEVAAPLAAPGGSFAASNDESPTTRDSVLDLDYSTYLGGRDFFTEEGYLTEQAGAVAVDDDGSAYVAGTTWDPNFPVTPGAFDTTLGGGRDIFVTKFAPDGSGLEYSTFLGGSSWDGSYGVDLAVDAAGNAFVVADTLSPDFPTTPGAFDRSYNTVRDAIVTKLTPDGGGLAYSTFLGSGGLEIGYGVAVDATGHAYVCGYAESSSFPTTPGAFDTTYNGFVDMFVAKLTRDGSALAYSTYLGGADYDTAYALGVDQAGAAYVAGFSESPNFPATAGAYDGTHGGSSDAVVAKLSPGGSTLAYSTFLGGAEWEFANDIAPGRNGSAYVTGVTTSPTFPTTSQAFDPTYNGGDFGDAFVAKLNATGSGLAYSTFLGGAGDDRGQGVVTVGDGTVYVTGETGSRDFPTTPGAHDRTLNLGQNPPYSPYHDAFLVRLGARGRNLIHSTYLGGRSGDDGADVSLDDGKRPYVIGFTSSSDFPVTPNAYDSTRSTFGDVFVTRFVRI